jgi:hypothetical protein
VPFVRAAARIRMGTRVLGLRPDRLLLELDRSGVGLGLLAEPLAGLLVECLSRLTLRALQMLASTGGPFLGPALSLQSDFVQRLRLSRPLVPIGGLRRHGLRQPLPGATVPNMSVRRGMS